MRLFNALVVIAFIALVLPFFLIALINDFFIYERNANND